MFEARYLDKADETRTFRNWQLDVVNMPGATVGRLTLQPGFRWSQDMKEAAGTETCQETHTGYVLSGRVHVRMDDGTEGELEEGQAFIISPGHDSWVVGDEPFVALDW
ncbi:MAG TPA: cupin domain-containing protein, partial [Actinopolymorphaceae bacterium]